MRVNTFHRHTVYWTSPALSGLIIAHAFHSFCFTFPFFLLCFIAPLLASSSSSSPSPAWTLVVLRGAPNEKSALWHGIITFAWCLVEILRIYWGSGIHRYRHVFYGMGFVFLSIFVQLPLLCVYWGATGEVSDVFFGICLTQVLGVLLESLLAVLWSVRVGQQELINFYIRLGAIQRQAAAVEVPLAVWKRLRRRDGNGGTEKKKGKK